MFDIKLKTFLTVAKVKNFTRAGEILNLTQPAVSQHIKFLENYYGVALINKHGRYISLTEEGRLLFESAKELELIFKDIEISLRNTKDIHRSYNVGASLTIGGYVLPQILASYKEHEKNTDIILQVHNTEEIINGLVNREIDLALVEGNFDKNRFCYKKFKDDELVLAVSPKNTNFRSDEVELDDVLYGNLILREKGSGTREVFENKLLELGYSSKSLRPYMELGSISAIKSLVELNLGYTIISRHSIKKELLSGTIKLLPIRGVTFYREFNFVYLNNSNMEFIDHFIDYCFTITD